MKELYSNAEDCMNLARFLKCKLKNKIQFVTGCNEVMQGKYYFEDSNGYIIREDSNAVNFSFKYLYNGFLSVSIDNNPLGNNSLGMNLSALSDFYRTISYYFGTPTIFYANNDEERKNVNLLWAFKDKEQTIENVIKGSFFTDKVDEIVVIDEENSTIKKDTRLEVKAKTGLPLEVLPWIILDQEEYQKYQTGTFNDKVRKRQ